MRSENFSLESGVNDVNLGTNDIAIDLFDSPEDAPKYTKPNTTAANLERAVIVGRGTVGGNATVDLVFRDPDGKQFVAMITGRLLRGVVAAVDGVEERTKDRPEWRLE